MPPETHSIIAQVREQLSQLEKRDWRLWCTVSIVGVLVGVALVALVTRIAFLQEADVHFEVTLSRQLAVGLFVLLALLNTYLLTRRLEVRRLRQKLIFTTIQSELVRLQSFTDPLTEVYNRRSLEDMAGRFISHARRLQKALSFLLIDVDRFKDVNTRFGHLTGDVVLAEIARLLKESVRGSDSVIRYGGDEFVIILADTPAVLAAKVVERIQASLHEWNMARHLENFEVTLSIGISDFREGKTLDELLDEADQEMYTSKKKRGALAEPALRS
jgi:diguanylate cyclase (GGDEF)-like protein